MQAITKAFFGQTVLSGVSLVVQEGEIHALLGENGAGKSTLMNILAGVLEKDAGTIFFEGVIKKFHTVKESEVAGIAFVHQELNVFNELMVYENIFLGKEPVNRFGKINRNQMIQETKALMSAMGVDLDPLAYAEALDTGKKQLIEIAKAFHMDAKLIILDEPTTALNNHEIELLFNMIRLMQQKGKSFIFISHKMPEIFAIANRYTVLRNGELVRTGAIAETTPKQVAIDMVGQAYSDKNMYVTRSLDEVVLEVKGLSGPYFKDIDFSVKKGEILGLTGLKGAGCSELLCSLFGVNGYQQGEVIIKGKKIPQKSMRRSMALGLGMVPANRKENSVIQDRHLLDNMIIAQHAKTSSQQIIFQSQEMKAFKQYQSMLNIKTRHALDPITSLSGGNQQKVILARWLYTQADIILLDNPTQGIDVGAKSEIYQLILELSKMGKTILVHTLEVPELQKLADRCMIFYHGQLVKTLEHDAIDEATVMLYATQALSDSQEKMEKSHACNT